MSRLQQLAQQDPSKFKAIASQGAQDLQVAAQKATAEQAQGLADLSNGFAQAAKAGNPSVLQPKAVIRTLGRGQHRVHTISGQAQAVLTNVSEKVDEALGLNPPPLGPWFPR
jgi:uncharacterized protein with von Willebrand factor type A (vWA) domain